MQVAWIALKARQRFEHDVILVQLGIESRNLALAEGVVERVVDHVGGDAHARSCHAVDHQSLCQSTHLLVGGHVAQLRNTLEFFYEPRGPQVQFVQIGIFQRELILRAAHAVFDREVLHGLHVERHAVDLLNLWLQPADHFRRIDSALFKWLQVDQDAAAVQRRIRSIDAYERGDGLNGGVLQDDSAHSALPLGHGGKRNLLVGLGETLDDSRVLHREKALGNRDVQKNRESERPQGDKKRRCLVLQYPGESAAVKRDD